MHMGSWSPLRPANSWSMFASIFAMNRTDSFSVYYETEKSTYTQTETLNATFLNPSPDCTIAPSKCTALWESYLEEQGMPTTFENATEPAITPVPTQRPRCSVGAVTAICQPIPKPSCVFSARKVDLYVSPPLCDKLPRCIMLTAE